MMPSMNVVVVAGEKKRRIVNNEEGDDATSTAQDQPGPSQTDKGKLPFQNPHGVVPESDIIMWTTFLCYTQDKQHYMELKLSRCFH